MSKFEITEEEKKARNHLALVRDVELPDARGYVRVNEGSLAITLRLLDKAITRAETPALAQKDQGRGLPPGYLFYKRTYDKELAKLPDFATRLFSEDSARNAFDRLPAGVREVFALAETLGVDLPA